MKIKKYDLIMLARLKNTETSFYNLAYRYYKYLCKVVWVRILMMVKYALRFSPSLLIFIQGSTSFPALWPLINLDSSLAQLVCQKISKSIPLNIWPPYCRLVYQSASKSFQEYRKHYRLQIVGGTLSHSIISTTFCFSNIFIFLFFLETLN